MGGTRRGLWVRYALIWFNIIYIMRTQIERSEICHTGFIIVLVIDNAWQRCSWIQAVHRLPFKPYTLRIRQIADVAIAHSVLFAYNHKVRHKPVPWNFTATDPTANAKNYPCSSKWQRYLTRRVSIGSFIHTDRLCVDPRLCQLTWQRRRWAKSLLFSGQSTAK